MSGSRKGLPSVGSQTFPANASAPSSTSMNRSESVEAALRPDAPRYLGLALIFAGIVALIIACWQYRVVERYLWEKPFTPLAGIHHTTMRTPLLAIAIGLTLIGLFAFGSVLTRAL